MNTNEQTIHQMGLGISSLVKQATGRESVSNIDMDWVSVEQLARYIYGSGSGDVVSFETNIQDAIESLIAYITAVQDTSGGDPSPSNVCPITGWNGCNVARTGKNLFGNGNQTIEGRYKVCSLTIPLQPGSYMLSAVVTSDDTDATTCRVGFFNDNDNTVGAAIQMGRTGRASNTFTITSECVKIYFYSSDTANHGTGDSASFTDIQIEIGTSASDYEAFEGDLYTFTFPDEAGTVYGGTLDVLTGVLTVTDANIASYNGETLPSTWISDRDVYAEGTTPTTGAQVVYKLSTPLTYQLTAQEVTALIGANNIFADTGNVSVQYKVKEDLV